MLLHGNGGGELGANRIRGVYYAHGIVLFAENEHNLQLGCGVMFPNKPQISFNPYNISLPKQY